MKIVKLELKNFKRFDDLTIDMTSLAEAPKLVLLIGTNGSGKSSVFDGLEALNKIAGRDSLPYMLPMRLSGRIDNGYYTKHSGLDYFIKASIVLGSQNNNAIILEMNPKGKSHDLPVNSFYGRTSIRQVPKLTKTTFGQGDVSFEEDSDRPRTFIDRDNRFENDIEKVITLILNDVFKGKTTNEAIIDSYINPINKAFENIFGIDESTGIKLISMTPPLEGNTAEILFEKGTSQIPYDFLSSGEKEIFNILLNLLTRKDYFTDTVYFMDEIDLHLNTLLQKNLLKEITENWIPENCQLWTASHSLGFIEYANEAEHAAIIDLDNLNFDVPQLITPAQKNNADVFEIAVSKEFLSKVFEGKKIVFSENTDTALYNNLNIQDTIFFNASNKADVFHKSKNNPAYKGLVDRDYLSDEERTDLLNQYANLYILEYYSIENYLFHHDNLEEYFLTIKKDFDRAIYMAAIENEKGKIRDKIMLGVAGARDSYPFYREPENSSKLKAMRSNVGSILKSFDSTDFETFYKVFPAKDYGTEIPQRQNLNRSDLAKTNWFKSKIEKAITK